MSAAELQKHPLETLNPLIIALLFCIAVPFRVHLGHFTNNMLLEFKASKPSTYICGSTWGNYPVDLLKGIFAAILNLDKPVDC